MEQRRLLESVALAFERPSTISLEGIIRYIPDLIKPGLTPTDPTKYNANLLLQPIKRLVYWWQNRPIAKLFDVAGKVSEIPEYESLIVKLFPEKFQNKKDYSWTSYLR